MNIEFWHIFLLVYGGVLAWLSLSNIKHGEKMAVMDTKLDAIAKSSETVAKRLDLFLRSEIDTLKELSKKD